MEARSASAHRTAEPQRHGQTFGSNAPLNPRRHVNDFDPADCTHETDCCNHLTNAAEADIDDAVARGAQVYLRGGSTMESIVGIFNSFADARRAAAILGTLDIPEANITVLSP